MAIIYTIRNLLNTKHYSFCLVFLLCCSVIEAQRKDSLHLGSPYISFSMGSTMPVGAYAAETGAGYGGYGMPGLSWGFAGSLPIRHSHWGIVLQYSHFSNRFNGDAYFNNVPPDPYSTNPYPQNKYFYDSSSTSRYYYYIGNTITGGISYTYRTTKFLFALELMSGIDLVQYPEITGRSGYWFTIGPPIAKTFNVIDYYSLYTSNNISTCFDVDAALKGAFFISESLGLFANIMFSCSIPRNRVVETIPLHTYTTSSSIPIELFMVQGGVFYRFGK